MKLFLSYRPADLDVVERLHDGLVAAFGYDPVVRDLEAVPVPAPRRAAYLEDLVRTVAAVLVVIGPGWVDAIDARGRRRLLQEDDPVRLVIEAAGSLRIPLVPLLVGGATLPDARELPESLRALRALPAHPLRAGSAFQADLDGLATGLVRLRDRPVNPVIVFDRKTEDLRATRKWTVLFLMRSMHRIVFVWTGFPVTLRLTVDERVVWESRRNWRRLPTVDVPFRIESENADCWLVLVDHSNWAIFGLSAELWIENTKVLGFRFPPFAGNP